MILMKTELTWTLAMDLVMKDSFKIKRPCTNIWCGNVHSPFLPTFFLDIFCIEHIHMEIRDQKIIGIKKYFDRIVVIKVLKRS